MLKSIKNFFIFSCLLFLISCGQSGRLFLPGPNDLPAKVALQK